MGPDYEKEGGAKGSKGCFQRRDVTTAWRWRHAVRDDGVTELCLVHFVLRFLGKKEH